MSETAMDAPVVEPLGPLSADTLQMLEALVEASGWNQLAHDWRLFERLGSIHGIRDADGTVIASGAVLPMARVPTAMPAARRQPAVSWISMILVAPAARGRGLGRAVFAHCLSQVRAQGRTAMLDATALGEPLYTGFGFSPLWRLTRWERAAVDAPPGAPAGDRPRAEGLAALDAEALGIARPEVLADLLAREGSRCVRNGRGFALVRRGRLAHHIGPLLAADEATAGALLREAAGGLAGRIFIDVPDCRVQLAHALREAGFAPQRGFARMALAPAGASAPAGQPAFIHAIAGPEFG